MKTTFQFVLTVTACLALTSLTTVAHAQAAQRLGQGLRNGTEHIGVALLVNQHDVHAPNEVDSQSAATVVDSAQAVKGTSKKLIETAIVSGAAQELGGRDAAGDDDDPALTYTSAVQHQNKRLWAYAYDSRTYEFVAIVASFDDEQTAQANLLDLQEQYSLEGLFLDVGPNPAFADRPDDDGIVRGIETAAAVELGSRASSVSHVDPEGSTGRSDLLLLSFRSEVTAPENHPPARAGTEVGAVAARISGAAQHLGGPIAADYVDDPAFTQSRP